MFCIKFQNANILRSICEEHLCSKEVNFYCHKCKKLICKECATVKTCKDHDNVPLAQASEIHKNHLKGSVELLQTKQKELQNTILEINTLHKRMHAAKKSNHVEGQHVSKLEEIMEKICQIRRELYQTSIEIHHAIQEVDRTLRAGENHLISGKFASLYSNLCELSKVHPRKITRDDLAELDLGRVLKGAVQEDGIYEVRGKQKQIKIKPFLSPMHNIISSPKLFIDDTQNTQK